MVIRSIYSFFLGFRNFLVVLYSFLKIIYVRENKVVFLLSEYFFLYNVDCIVIMYSKNKNKLV